MKTWVNTKFWILLAIIAVASRNCPSGFRRDAHVQREGAGKGFNCWCLKHLLGLSDTSLILRSNWTRSGSVPYQPTKPQQNYRLPN